MEFYHLLNRGVDKRRVFMDKIDYSRFLYDLIEFNNINNVSTNNSRNAIDKKDLTDIGCPSNERLVNVHFFCLMPNHYHLLVSPNVENGIALFMKKLNMGYTKYFNERYKRSGALWQGKYKSVLIKDDAHFIWIPYYIHFNPLDLKMPEWRKGEIQNRKLAGKYLQSYRWSSHNDYLGNKTSFSNITNRRFFLEYFGGESSYKKSIIEHLNKFDCSDLEGVTLE